MTVKEISKEEFAAIFGLNEVHEGNFAYYLTVDNIGIRKNLRMDTVEFIGKDYEYIHEEQLERDILNTVCGDFKAYDLGPTNRPFWEWEEEAKPNLFLYYFPQVGIFVFLVLLMSVCLIFGSR